MIFHHRYSRCTGISEWVLWLIFLMAMLAAPPGLAEEVSAGSVAEFLNQNCLDCHDGQDAEAGLDLNEFSRDLSDAEIMRKWVRVVDRVADREMPPRDSVEVEPTVRASFVDEASRWIVDFETQRYETVGRVPLRRLTHAQVERSLHDLLAIDLPLAELVPADPRTDGYTTIADGQPMSHFQLQSHLTIVDAALDNAFARAAESPQAEPEFRDLTARKLSRANPRQRCREPELIDDRAVVWMGGVTFYGRLPSTQASEDGWYEFTIRASALNVPDEHGVWCSVRSGECVSSAPLLNWIGAFEADEHEKEMKFVAWLPEGHMLEIRPADSTLKSAKFQGGQIGTGEGAPQNVSGVAIRDIQMNRIHPGGSVLDVRNRLFGDCRKSFLSSKRGALESENAKAEIDKQIAGFAERAFRRPITDDQAEAYASIFDKLLASGETPLESLKACYRAILCSPRFVYFQEPAGELDDFAIASRMSYLVTGSTPDDELLRVAKSDGLRDREVLAKQVNRLLGTTRGREFVNRFTDEWLDLVDINFTEPDRKLYRDFDQIVENSMLAETRTYIADMLEHDRSIARLVDSDYTFANSRLARFYELSAAVESDQLQSDAVQRVALRPEDHRGGIMAQGAILKVTANGTNTSPVLRGVWLARRLLGETIPPPPSGVSAIEPDIRGATTIREQLELHRDDVSCASCHRKIDPAGFALEKFDPAGRFRIKYVAMQGGKLVPKTPIDSSYVLADGRKFDDFDGFQDLLLTDVRPIARNFVEHLLTYGTGALPTFADRESIEKIVSQCADDDYGMRSLVVAAVTSPIFLSK